MTIRGMTHIGRWPLAPFIFALAAAVLSFEPIEWLVKTWLEPAYDSKGLYIFAGVAELFLWSLTAKSEHASVPHKRFALALLVMTALVRLIGQVLAVNTIGALALVIDVYALGLLAGLNQRARPLSPGWLAFAFAFSLPLERIAQRTIGYGLQNLSADGACLMLRGFYDDVRCHGVRILLGGADVLVDLPCSGARTLLLLLLGFCVTASIVRPTFKQALIGGTVTLIAGLLANMLRISVLAVGLAEPERFYGIDVMAQPWHDVIGWSSLVIALIPLLLWSNYISRRRPRKTADYRHRPYLLSRTQAGRSWLQGPNSKRPGFGQVAPALSFLLAAAVIVSLPRTAIDVAQRPISIDLPERLAGLHATRIALQPSERSYFVKYGGAAQKAAYGPFQLLIVRTSAPLRHLHAPDECLRGLGMTVRYLGVDRSAPPSAVYSASTPEGDRYRIDVSFVSDSGQVTTNVSEAVWRWLQQPESTWSAVQRISPIGIADADRYQFNAAVTAALDLPQASQLPTRK